MRTAIRKARRLVVKVGTGTLTDSSGRFDRKNCERLAGELAALALGQEGGGQASVFVDDLVFFDAEVASVLADEIDVEDAAGQAVELFVFNCR